jgi:hypothetical protein
MFTAAWLAYGGSFAGALPATAGGGPASDLGRTPVNLRIITGPHRHVASHAATIAFKASEAAYHFRCQLDFGKRMGCSSPVTYRHLSSGEHTFQVSATTGSESEAVIWLWMIE